MSQDLWHFFTLQGSNNISWISTCEVTHKSHIKNVSSLPGIVLYLLCSKIMDHSHTQNMCLLLLLKTMPKSITSVLLLKDFFGAINLHGGSINLNLGVSIKKKSIVCYHIISTIVKPDEHFAPFSHRQATNPTVSWTMTSSNAPSRNGQPHKMTADELILV